MRSMLGNKTQTEIWGYIHKDDGVALINHWENLSISLKKIFACLYRRQKLIRADKLFYPCRRYFSTV